MYRFQIPYAEVIAAINWGDGPYQVPLRHVAVSFFGDAIRARPRLLRPVCAVRPYSDDELLILAGGKDESEQRSFLRRTAEGDLRGVLVGSHTRALSAWTIVDFEWDASGGIYLLEFLEDSQERWLNRVRRVDDAGRTSWSHEGKVDMRTTDPARLVGSFVGLKRTGDGLLWVIPRQTSAGLMALDPDTGEIRTITPLDADIANLVISRESRAIYGFAAYREGQPQPVLAITDLRSGRTVTREPVNVPLLDLVGTDDAGQVYARAFDGIVRLDINGKPNWQVPLRGAVYTGSQTLFAAYDCEQTSELVIVEHQTESAYTRSWTLPRQRIAEDDEEQTAVLVDVESGPRFVFHVGGSAATAGRLVTIGADGTILTASGYDDDVADELLARESRLDLSLAAVTPGGCILVPFSDPAGYRVLRFWPQSGPSAPSGSAVMSDG